MMRKGIYFLFILFCAMNIPLSAQQGSPVTGRVFTITDGQKASLPGANIYWLGSNTGTTSDSKGYFSLPGNGDTFIVSFTGYQSDTVEVGDRTYFEIELSETLELEAVEITAKERGAGTSLLNPIQTTKITETELKKAACCNLSESFETTPTVDISYSDAVTGAKEIQMLGLDGIYTQLLAENLPYMRGLAAPFGITYLPGTWMEAIYVSKGTGSVVNGYEAITGQINVELKEPLKTDRFFINLFSDQEARSEVNIHASHRFSKRVGTVLLTHGARAMHQEDENDDGFMDMPIYERIAAMNRWSFHFTENWEAQAGGSFLMEDRMGGNMEGEGPMQNGVLTPYIVDIENRQWEAYLKSGYVFNEIKAQSLGTMFSVNNYTQHASFGGNPYKGIQRSGNASIMYQTKFISPDHLMTTGVNLNYDNIKEEYKNIYLEREEIVPGAFAEYSYNKEEKLKLLGGIRLDYNNLFGLFFAPKFNVRYSFTPETVVRLNAGRGYRTANVLAENTQLLVSSREIIIEEPLVPEVGWNTGASFTRYFKWNTREGSFTVDFYHTEFESQTILDVDHDVDEIHIYNLRGRSFSNSFQAEVDHEVLSRLDVRLAYKYNDVRVTYHGELLEKPLVPKHYALINLSYATPFEKWVFDFTTQWRGEQRLPQTSGNPEEYRQKETSPAYFTLLTQITKKFKNLELYLGGENLTGFRQENVIIAANDPFGPYFDASMVWGPVNGRKIYGGIRYSIPYK